MENLTFNDNSNTTVDNSVTTTTFVDDESKIEQSYLSTSLPDDIDFHSMSVVDFMNKPFLVSSGTWTTGQTQGTELLTFSVAAQLSANPYWANKIQGFGLVRGNVVARLQINASPFQQGKLLMHFLPCEAQYAAADPSFAAMHNATIATKLMQPHVECDCRDTVAVMSMPYIAPSFWYSIKDGKYDWGNFHVCVLAPLATGTAGETSLNYSVYLHFEDFELSAPTVPQSGIARKKYRVGNTAEKEAAATKGPVSSALSTAASIATALSAVPILTPLAEPASWVLAGASGIASWFGWSKPRDTSIATMVSNQYNRYGATSDGVDAAFPLGLRSDNRLSVTTGMSLTDEDEMSFSFLKKVKTLAQTYTWATSAASGTPLVSIQMNPQSTALNLQGSVVHGGHTLTYATGPPIAYLSQYFQFWRGSFEVTIKLAKTDFHTGRLQVTWTPGTGGFTTPTLTTSNLSLREIIDIRDGNEFTLNLPYMIPYSYLPVNTSSGQLDIVILNELRCPETASQNVSVLLYYGGGDDYEYEVPSSNPQTNAIGQIVSPQGGGEVLVDEGVGGEARKAQVSKYAQYSIGEMFSSIKQILSRNMWQQCNGTFGSSAGVAIWPWLSGVGYINSTTGVQASPVAGGDFYSAVASMYAFYRGGVRVTLSVAGGQAQAFAGTILPQFASSTNVVASAVSNIGLVGPIPWFPLGPGNALGACGTAISNQNIGQSSFSVPYYSRMRASLVLNQTTSNAIPTEASQSVALLNVLGTLSSGTAFYRSFDDDFQLTYFLGTPPWYVGYV